MRHRKKRTLRGSKDRARKELRALVTSLILYEHIETTQARAKLARVKIERIITKGKKGDLNARRQLLRDLSRNVASKVIDVLSPRYKTREGGYTRMVKVGQYKDGTQKVRFEFVK